MRFGSGCSPWPPTPWTREWGEMTFGPFKFNMARSPSWRDSASNVAEWDAWDRAWRHKLGWRAGLKIWGQTNMAGSRTLISRHWPHRLCWDWSVWVGRWREGHDGPRRCSIVVSRPYRFAEIWVWTHYARLSWQNSQWMVAVGPTYRPGAPKIYWKHHLENAIPAGTA
jgi:hypothetical protein